MRRTLLILLALAALGLGAGTWYVYRSPYFPAARFPDAAEATIERFVARDAPTRADYESLVGYFLEGFLTYATPGRARARYPGLRAGGASPAEQEMEGFSRVAPLAAVWLAANPAKKLALSSGREVDVAALLRSAVLAGTDPAAPDYWGTIEDRDQRIAEAADVALALWISRAALWNTLEVREREQIARWLLQVNGKTIADNNWHLFVVQVNVALQALGAEYDANAIEKHLARTLEFYRGDGWFVDGPDGFIDYYNAWGFHYHVAWIHRMNPTLLTKLVTEAYPVFGADLLHLIGPHGIPVMGRSVCYRLAVSAPLIFASRLAPQAVSAGQARRALDLTWKFFLGHGAVRDGRMTQGYCGDDARVLDNYSGAASCLWSLRSLVAALDIGADQPFWTEPAAPLPVQLADFERPIASGRWIARGNVATGEITLLNPAPLPETQTALEPFPFLDRVKSVVRGGSWRPKNEAAKYRRASYGSMQPFCGCPP